MKKLLMLLTILIVFAISASAQTPKPFSLYVGGALSLPTSPDAFKENFKTGFHGSVGVGYKMAPNFQLIGKVEYHVFNFDFDNSEIFAGETGYSGGTNKMLMFGVDGRYNLNLPAAPVCPFFLGGVGLANMSQTDFEGPSSLTTSLLNEFNDESQTKIYYSLGTGLDLKSGPMFSFFAQVRYVSIATEGESSSFIPVTIGLKFF